MTIAGYSFSITTLAVAAMTALWLLVILIAILSWERRVQGMSRKIDRFALVVTLVFGALWFYTFRGVSDAKPHPVESQTSCSVVKMGDSEATVKRRLGDPDEILGEEDTRGPAANVFIYRQARCTVHLFGDTVESVE